jgi:hypothetical protein
LHGLGLLAVVAAAAIEKTDRAPRIGTGHHD